MPNDSNVKLLLVALLAYCLGAGVFNPTLRQAAKLFPGNPAPNAESHPPSLPFDPNSSSDIPPGALINAAQEESVAFNTETMKYHCLDCQWARRCTRHCQVVPLSEAKRLGGIACKVCGGRCRGG